MHTWNQTGSELNNCKGKTALNSGIETKNDPKSQKDKKGAANADVSEELTGVSMAERDSASSVISTLYSSHRVELM